MVGTSLWTMPPVHCYLLVKVRMGWPGAMMKLTPWWVVSKHHCTDGLHLTQHFSGDVLLPLGGDSNEMGGRLSAECMIECATASPSVCAVRSSIQLQYASCSTNTHRRMRFYGQLHHVNTTDASDFMQSHHTEPPHGAQRPAAAQTWLWSQVLDRTRV